MLREQFADLKVEPQNIWNMDESPFFWSLTTKKVTKKNNQIKTN